MPIRRKLGLAAMVPCAVGLLCATALLVQRYATVMREENESEVRVLARIMADTSAAALAFGDVETAHEILESLRVHPDVLSARLLRADGGPFAAYRLDASAAVPDREGRGDGVYVTEDRVVVFEPVEQKEHRLGTLVIEYSLAALNAQTRQNLGLAGGVLAGSLGVALLLSTAIQRLISRPILQLAATTRKVREHDDYGVRAEKAGDDEVGFLIDSFNSMLERIESREGALAESKRELEQVLRALERKNLELEQIVYVTSHDLRSPLVNIQGFSMELQHTCDDLVRRLRQGATHDDTDVAQLMSEEIPQILGFIQVSGSKMEKLLAGLLKLSRSGRAPLELRELDMNRLMTNVLTEFEYVAKEREISIAADDLPGCHGDEVQLNQVFSNLVSNAIKYRDPERACEITVTGRRDDGRSVYCVADNGIGISEPHQHKIFDVFHRLHPDMGEGDGLGLAIVRKSLDRQGGSIWLESESGRGSRFFVAMPASGPQAAAGSLREAM
jgi:signal transduction histidine kinase